MVLWAFFAQSPLTAAAGELEIKGSSTIYPVCKQASSKYYIKTKKIVICEGGGSGFGVKFALAGGLGSVSRDLNPTEKKQGLEASPIGLDALAFLVAQSNPLQNIEVEQLKKIFSGETTLWSSLNSAQSGSIVALGPNSDHGTYDSVLSFLELKTLSKDYTGFASHNETIFRAEALPNVIAVVPLGFWNQYVHDGKNKLRALLIHGIKPNSENLIKGVYPSGRSLNLVWKGNLSEDAKSFINFLKSPEGRSIIDSLGFSPPQ